MKLNVECAEQSYLNILFILFYDICKYDYSNTVAKRIARAHTYTHTHALFIHTHAHTHARPTCVCSLTRWSY